MDENSPSIQALSAFIASQNALIARTREDLVRLKSLREAHASADTPAAVNLASLGQEVLPWDVISAQSHNLMRGFDWSIFANYDVKPLKDFAASVEQAHARRTQPSLNQTSPLSPLQLLVKGSKKAIIMPVLEALDLSFDPPPLSPIPMDIAASHKALERAKIMDMKNRQLFGGSSLTIRQSEPDSVYMRLDLEDESGVVDVDMSGEQKPLPSAQRAAAVIDNGNEGAELRTLVTSGSSLKPINERPARGANARKKKRENSPPTGPSVRKMNLAHDRPESDVAFGTPMENAPPAGDEAVPNPPIVPNGKKAKPKPATYKLAWSVEEQHLLEQLLEKFPSGSKNRWLQISKAMNGRRTPRQVASRVQKYFEKLKRFGLEEEGACSVKDQDNDEGE